MTEKERSKPEPSVREPLFGIAGGVCAVATVMGFRLLGDMWASDSDSSDEKMLSSILLVIFAAYLGMSAIRLVRRAFW